MLDGIPFPPQRLEAFEPICKVGFETGTSALKHGLAQDLRGWLISLSNETLEFLTAVSYHDVGSLSRLKRIISHSIINADEGQARPNSFAFKEFRQEARQPRTKLHETGRVLAKGWYA